MPKTLSQELRQLAVALRQDRILDSEVVMVERAAKLLEFAPASPSQVLVNALRDPAYAPYCMTTGCMRMQKVAHLHWRCACGGEHDAYPELEALLAELGFTRNGYSRTPSPDGAALKRVLNKLSWAVNINPAEDPADATFEYPLTSAEALALQTLLSIHLATTETGAAK